MEIDVEKLSAETRWRLMRFADVFESYPGLEKFDRTDEKGFDEFWDVKKTLDNCPEPEVRRLVDRMNLDKALQSVENEGPEEREDAALKMRDAEFEAVELCKRCRTFIKNLKK